MTLFRTDTGTFFVEISQHRGQIDWLLAYAMSSNEVRSLNFWPSTYLGLLATWEASKYVRLEKVLSRKTTFHLRGLALLASIVAKFRIELCVKAGSAILEFLTFCLIRGRLLAYELFLGWNGTTFANLNRFDKYVPSTVSRTYLPISHCDLVSHPGVTPTRSTILFEPEGIQRTTRSPMLAQSWLRFVSKLPIGNFDELVTDSSKYKFLVFAPRRPDFDNLTQEESREVLSAIIDVLNEFPNLICLTKPHPRQRGIAGVVHERLLSVSAHPASLVAHADLVITEGGTIAIDADAFGKMTIEVHTSREPKPEGFQGIDLARWGLSTAVTPSELSTTLRRWVSSHVRKIDK